MPLVRLENLQQFAAVNLLLDPGVSREKLRIPSCAQVTLNWTLDGGKVGHNVMYGRFATSYPGSVANADIIKTNLTNTAAWTSLTANLSSSTALASVSVRNVDIVDQQIFTSIGATSPGTGGALAMPNEVAAALTLRTATAGRSGHGRIYIPGFIQTASVAGNIIGPGVVTNLNAWAATIQGAFTAAGYTLVLGLPHRIAYTSLSGTAHPDRPATSVTVTQVVLRDNHWDSQRRRGLK